MLGWILSLCSGHHHHCPFCTAFTYSSTFYFSLSLSLSSHFLGASFWSLSLSFTQSLLLMYFVNWVWWKGLGKPSLNIQNWNFVLWSLFWVLCFSSGSFLRVVGSQWLWRTKGVAWWVKMWVIMTSFQWVCVFWLWMTTLFASNCWRLCFENANIRVCFHSLLIVFNFYEVGFEFWVFCNMWVLLESFAVFEILQNLCVCFFFYFFRGNWM